MRKLIITNSKGLHHTHVFAGNWFDADSLALRDALSQVEPGSDYTVRFVDVEKQWIVLEYTDDQVTYGWTFDNREQAMAKIAFLTFGEADTLLGKRFSMELSYVDTKTPRWMDMDFE